MIVDAVVSAFLACVDALLSLLPAWSLPDTGMNGALDLVLGAARVFPLATFCAGLIAYVALTVGLASFRLALFVWHQIHGSN